MNVLAQRYKCDIDYVLARKIFSAKIHVCRNIKLYAFLKDASLLWKFSRHAKYNARSYHDIARNVIMTQAEHKWHCDNASEYNKNYFSAVVCWCIRVKNKMQYINHTKTNIERENYSLSSADHVRIIIVHYKRKWDLNCGHYGLINDPGSSSQP